MKPYLFLDIDGVLNVPVRPYRVHTIDVTRDEMPRSPFVNEFRGDVITFSLYLPRAYRDWLGELADVYELAWATTWEHLANRYVAPLLGLGELTTVAFSTLGLHQPTDTIETFKWRCLLATSPERPFVWIDDDADVLSRQHLLEPGAPHVALWAPRGLTRQHVDALLAHAPTVTD